MQINYSRFNSGVQKNGQKDNSNQTNVFNRNNQSDSYSFSTQKKNYGPSFGFEPITTLGYIIYSIVTGLATTMAVGAAISVVGAGLGYVVTKGCEWFDERRERAANKVQAQYQADIAKIAAKNPQLPQKQIEKMYDAKLLKTLIEPTNNGNEVGLNKVMGMYDLKYALTKDVLMPLCETLDGNNQHYIVPNGINLFGTPGTGKSFIAEQLGEHYKEKGGFFEKIELSENHPDNDIPYLRQTFADAEKRYINSGKTKYTIILLDELEKRADKNDSSQKNRAATILQLANNCKDRGVILVTTANELKKLEPALLRKGRIDKKYASRGIENYELADTIKYYLAKNGMRQNIKDEEYEGIIKSLGDNGKYVFKPKDVEQALNSAYRDVKDYGGYLSAQDVQNELSRNTTVFTKTEQEKLDADKDYAKRELGGYDEY